jgi:hypothetical protein
MNDYLGECRHAAVDCYLADLLAPQDFALREATATDVAAASADPNVVGVRRFLGRLAADPRLLASAIQTVGSKG